MKTWRFVLQALNTYADDSGIHKGTSKDLNLTMNHCELGVFFPKCVIGTEWSSQTSDGMREIKRNYAFLILRVFYLVQKSSVSSVLESWLGCFGKGLAFSLCTPTANTDSHSNGVFTERSSQTLIYVSSVNKKRNDQTRCHGLMGRTKPNTYKMLPCRARFVP